MAVDSTTTGPILQALLNLADAVGRSTTLDDIFDAALDGIAAALGIERASILLFDDDGVMRFKAWRGLSESYRAAVEGHTPWRAGEVEPQPVLVPDVALDPSLREYLPVFQREGIAALGFVPLLNQRRVIGKFMLYFGQPHVLTAAEVETARIIGHQVGFAVERTRGLASESLVRDRLTELTEGAHELLSSLSAESVNAQVLALAARVIDADAYAVWRRSGELWHIAAHQGLSSRFASETARSPADPLLEPFVAEDVNEAPALAARRHAYAADGLRSVVSVPLIIRGESTGGIAFYRRVPHRPSEVEMRVVVALGHLAAAAVTAADLYEEHELQRGRAQEDAARAAFLAEAGVLLSTLDDEANLRQLAELAVPRLADWCAVDLLTAAGTIERIAVVHTDPAKVRLAWELHQRYPMQAHADRGIGRVLRTGTPELYADIPESLLASVAIDDAHLQLLRDLELRSAIVVPLAAGRTPFGALTLVSTRQSRCYTADDLQFAAELARRAAYAVENARLFRRAQEANRLKDEFLATLSHELRTPLNVMVGRARMLADARDPDVRASAIAISRNGATLTRLVEDLLDVSRITLGRLKLDAVPLQIADVVDAAMQAVQAAARAKGVAMCVEARPSIPTLLGDPTRLQQVIWNLLSNAVRFTPPGGRVTTSITHEGGHVVVTVADTGDGIEPSFIPHVFDMFRQEDSPRTPGGLGLGLSIVKQLVELHGGSVSAASDGRGAGATFTVRLPVAAAV